MDEILALKQKLETERPARYEQLPDIELYKDQLLTYMTRKLAGGGQAEELTGAMVNNYIKNGLLPRPAGKRYTRCHLACLTAICQLKQVLSVSQTHALLKAQPDLENPQEFYNRYLASLDRAMDLTAGCLQPGLSRQEIAKQALDLCLNAYAQQQAALSLLSILEQT